MAERVHADEPIDVVVIGGGPAGAAAGRLLASWGHSVRILARPADPLRALADWGARQAGGPTALHLACGTPLETVWYCRTCGEPVADDEAGELDFA